MACSFWQFLFGQENALLIFSFKHLDPVALTDIYHYATPTDKLLQAFLFQRVYEMVGGKRVERSICHASS
jgi:hypothetical protein